jgi:hypothetical protein
VCIKGNHILQYSQQVRSHCYCTCLHTISVRSCPIHAWSQVCAHLSLFTSLLLHMATLSSCRSLSPSVDIYLYLQNPVMIATVSGFLHWDGSAR